MFDTGRIHEPVPLGLRAFLFGERIEQDQLYDLRRLADIDRAHSLMLTQVGILDRSIARRVLAEIDRLESTGFAEIMGRKPVRGLYLLWETLLRERLGDEVGGAIHLARSRNDIGATAIRMQLREEVLTLVRETVDLNGTLLSRAESGVEMLTVGYTQNRPAMPLTVGHQLAGWSTAVCRDINGIITAGAGMEECPMGAGAVGGTALPIDPSLTARFLGFKRSMANSLDAVASRDFALRVLASVAILGVTLSRFGTELQHWAMEEIGFVRLSDTLVGSSSQMPQKRNPFLLEHIQARPISALGAFLATATRMHAMPFSNSVAVGTESVRGIQVAIQDTREAAVLLKAVVGGMEFLPDVMTRAAVSSCLNCTALAERVAVRTGMSFRDAHRTVGAMVEEATTSGIDICEVARWHAELDLPEEALQDLDPLSVALRGNFGGGPGVESVKRQLASLQGAQNRYLRDVRRTERTYREARVRLLEASRSL